MTPRWRLRVTYGLSSFTNISLQNLSDVNVALLGLLMDKYKAKCYNCTPHICVIVTIYAKLLDPENQHEDQNIIDFVNTQFSEHRRKGACSPMDHIFLAGGLVWGVKAPNSGSDNRVTCTSKPLGKLLPPGKLFWVIRILIT